MVVNGVVIENLYQHRDLEANKKGRENKCGNDEGGEGYFRHFSHGANMSCTLFISAIRNSNSISYKCPEMHPLHWYYFHNRNAWLESRIRLSFWRLLWNFPLIYFFNSLVLLIVATLRIIYSWYFLTVTNTHMSILTQSVLWLNIDIHNSK